MIPIKTLDIIEYVEKECPDLYGKEVKKLASDLSLVAFGELCCPNSVTKNIPEIHYQLYEKLMDENATRLGVALPRGLAKSTISSFLFPLWKVLTSTRPELIAIISESSQQAKNFLSRIKNNLSYNDNLVQLYGHFGEATARRWREDDIILKNGNRIIALGSRQKIRGFTQDDTRFTTIVLDDIESEINAITSEARIAIRKWATEAVIPSLVQDGTGKVVSIGTPLAEDSFICYCKKAAENELSGWTMIWQPVLNEYGESIWPETYTREVIEAKKAEYESFGNLGGFFQEYMLEFQAPEDAPFQARWFKTYNYEIFKDQGTWWYNKPDNEGEYCQVPLNLYMGVDLASATSIKSDFTVLLTIGIDPYKNVFIVDMVRGKSNPAKHPTMIFEKFLQYRHKGVFIESIAYQEACRQHVRQLMIEAGEYIPGIERKITTRTSKSERLLSLVPYFATGKMHLRPGEIELLNELKSFPRGEHDDILDALWLALLYARSPVGEEVKGEKHTKRHNFIDGWTI